MVLKSHPRSRLLVKIGFICHVTSDGRVITEDRILRTGLRDFTVWKKTFRCGRMSSQSCP